MMDDTPAEFLGPLPNAALADHICFVVTLHWFSNITEVIEDGTVDIVDEDGNVTGSEFNADRIFPDPEYWEYEPES